MRRGSPKPIVHGLGSACELLERLGRIAVRLGTRAFLVGGPVRDIVLGDVLGTRSEIPEGFRSCPSDIDIAVEDRAREFGNAVARELGGRFVFHERFLSGTVQMAWDTTRNPKTDFGHVPRIDITQTRTELYHRPAVLPQVKPAGIVADLARRDFSINAMAFELTPGSFGTFIDPHDGRRDLKREVVRVLHDRSFLDDPTRIFRCIRLATRFGFRIEPHTLKLMRQAIGVSGHDPKSPEDFGHTLALLTPERVLYELRCICAEAKATAIVRRLVRERVLEAAWHWTPPQGFLAGLARVARMRDEGGRMKTPELLFVYWLSVLPVTDRFPIRKEERDAAAAIAACAELKHKLKRKLGPSAIFRALRPVPETALRILAAVESGRVRQNLRLHLDELSRVRISTTGVHLRRMGIKPGPVYRMILDKLLFARLDGRIRTVADEHELLARLVRPGTRPELPERNSVMSRASRT